MKNLKLILLVLVLSLASCDDTLIQTNKVLPEPYIVKSIETYNTSSNGINNIKPNIFCIYHLDNGQSYVYFENSINVVDSIGKYNIGDTITIRTIK